MLYEILRFEWRYHTRRLTLAAAAVLFTLAGFMTTARLRPGLDIDVNAPYALASATGLLSLGGVLLVTLLCVQAVLRDSEHAMAEIVHATAVPRATAVAGRFGGVVAATAAALAFAQVGMVLGAVLPPHDPAVVGPFDLLDHLVPYALLAVPNVVIAGAVLFAVAVLSRNALATYVCGVALYMLYFLAAMLTGSPLIASSSPPTPEGLRWAALADPFGLSAFFEQTHYWTPEERNDLRIAPVGNLLFNRLLWTGLAVMLLCTVHRRFAFRSPRVRIRGDRFAVDVDAPDTREGATLRSVAPSPRAGVRFALAFFAALRSHTRHVVLRWPFAALMMLWVGFNAIEAVQFLGNGEFGTRRLPDTAVLVGRMQEPLLVFGLLAIIFFGAELIWRDRALRTASIVDASPAPGGAFLAAVMAALTMLVGALAAAAAGVGIVAQLAAGAARIDLAVYAVQLGLTSAALMLFAVLAVLMQTLSPNRHVGMLATLVAYAFITRGAFGGPEHPLLRYGALPLVPPSGMIGLGPEIAAFLRLLAYWAAVAGLLLVVILGAWRRGTETRATARMARFRRRIGPRACLGATLLAAATAALGGALFHDTNVVNTYRSRADVLAWRADYERAYRRIEHAPQPVPEHMTVEVDLFPTERRYVVRGRYRLRNATETPIDTVWLTASSDVTMHEPTLDGAPPARFDARFGVYVFEPVTPLAPGAAAELVYTVEVDRRPLSAAGTSRDIVANGSFVLSGAHLPRLGYRVARELSDPVRRRAHGLPPDERPRTVEAAMAHGVEEDLPWRMTWDVTLSTDADQEARAPGRLVAAWRDGERNHARFVMTRPSPPRLAYVSARYAVRSVRHGGVDVEVLYHPEHATNVPRFLEAATQALDTFATHFGPYPHDHLRLIEVPAGRPFTGMAAVGTTYYVETAGFLTDLRDRERIDVITKRVSHEVAHQWWGGTIDPASVPGAPVIVESLARYSELVMLRRRHGPGAVTAALGFELDRYLAGRAHQSEVPLIQAHDEPFLFYAKGALVMMAVDDLLGENAVLEALAGFARQAATSDAPVTSLDLFEALRSAAPAEHRALIDQWWRQVVLYDLRIGDARAEQLADGRYRVVAHVTAGKHALVDGEATALAMAEAIEIAVHDRYPTSAASRDGLIQVERRVLGGDTEVVLEVNTLPRTISVDPFLRRIDRIRVDNVAEVAVYPHS